METHNYFRAAEEQFDAMKGFLQSSLSQKLDLSGLEDRPSNDGRELLRQLLLAHIAERHGGDMGPCVVGADGSPRTHKRLRTRSIMTLFGSIPIQRVAYAMPHVSSLFPLDAMLNLPPINISYTLQKHLILEVVNTSFNEALETLTRWTGISITKEHAQQIVREAAQDFTSFYAARSARERPHTQPLPLLILTTDGKGVLVKTDDLRKATRQKRLAQSNEPPGDPLDSTTRMYTRRMATVASVYEIARFPRTADDIVGRFFDQDSRTAESRPHPQAKRLWASVTHSSEAVIRAVFEDALRRDPQHKKEWVVLVDGDPHQIQRIQTCASRCGVSVTIVCDIVHVLGYLWKAGAVLQRAKLVAPWVRDTLLRVLLGHSATVAAAMRGIATRRHLAPAVRKPLDVCARYLCNHAPYLDYRRYLKHGYPIATGVIEGACRYLVKDRMELTGARWRLEGAEAVLKLRAIKVSVDFTAYWKFYEQQQYERIYKNRYQDPSVLTKGRDDHCPLS